MLCSDTLILFEAIHKEATKQLLFLPVSFDYFHLLVEVLLGLALLVSYLFVCARVCQTIFSHMFRMPRPPVPLTFYGTLIVDLFKAQPKILPPVVGPCVCVCARMCGLCERVL